MTSGKNREKEQPTFHENLNRGEFLLMPLFQIGDFGYLRRIGEIDHCS